MTAPIKEAVRICLEGRLLPAASEEEINEITQKFICDPWADASKILNEWMERAEIKDRVEAARQERVERLRREARQAHNRSVWDRFFKYFGLYKK